MKFIYFDYLVMKDQRKLTNDNVSNKHRPKRGLPSKSTTGRNTPVILLSVL